MSFDLSELNIEDTYQNVTQVTGSNQLFTLDGRAVGDLKITGSLYANEYVVTSSVTEVVISKASGSTEFGDSADDIHQFTGSIFMSATSTGSFGTGSFGSLGSDLKPAVDNTYKLGSSTNRFADGFFVQTTVGGVFEVGLRTTNIGMFDTGTVVVWRDDHLVPCDTELDQLVMGVIKNGKDEPIVLGAEPVLVTGDIAVGDFIVTSDKVGHGTAVKHGMFFKKDLFGKVIAQALENGSGESHIVKAMVRKM